MAVSESDLAVNRLWVGPNAEVEGSLLGCPLSRLGCCLAVGLYV